MRTKFDGGDAKFSITETAITEMFFQPYMHLPSAVVSVAAAWQ